MGAKIVDTREVPDTNGHMYNDGSYTFNFTSYYFKIQLIVSLIAVITK